MFLFNFFIYYYYCSYYYNYYLFYFGGTEVPVPIEIALCGTRSGEHHGLEVLEVPLPRLGSPFRMWDFSPASDFMWVWFHI